MDPLQYAKDVDLISTCLQAIKDAGRKNIEEELFKEAIDNFTKYLGTYAYLGLR